MTDLPDLGRSVRRDVGSDPEVPAYLPPDAPRATQRRPAIPVQATP